MTGAQLDAVPGTLAGKSARVAKEQADNVELRNQQLRRELAPIAMITWVLQYVAGHIAARLETIPVACKRAVPQLTAHDLDLIRREVVKAQNAAMDVRPDWGEYDP